MHLTPAVRGHDEISERSVEEIAAHAVSRLTFFDRALADDRASGVPLPIVRLFAAVLDDALTADDVAWLERCDGSLFSFQTTAWVLGRDDTTFEAECREEMAERRTWSRANCCVRRVPRRHIVAA